MTQLKNEAEWADDGFRASLIEADMIAGVKRIPGDLAWYIGHMMDKLAARSNYWRHKESEVVYTLRGMGLASTGMGTLALMVHYFPENWNELRLERQYLPFLEKFEPVVAATVWERAL